MDRHRMRARRGVAADGVRTISARRERTRPAQTAAVVALAGATGLLVVAAPAVSAAPLALASLAVAATSRPGVRAETVRGSAGALLMLAILDGIPGLDLSGRLPGGVRAQDGAVAVLVLFLAVCAGQDRGSGRRASAARRWVTGWSAVFVAWWLVTVVRTIVGDDAPALETGLFGRDFLYFALILGLLVRVRVSRRTARAFGTVAVGGASIFAGAEIVNSLGLANLGALTHSSMEVATGDVVRIYASMNDLVTVVLSFALAAVLLAPESRVRSGAGLLLALCGGAFVLQLTRASYVGVFLAGGALIGWWMLAAPVSWRDRLQRRALAAVVGGAVLLGAAVLIVPGTADNPAVGAVATRVQSGFTDVSQSTGNVGYRKDVYRTMLQVLGGDWPVGLGFLHPAFHYFAELPSGSIRNTDVGLLNVLMTMGAIGTVLLLCAPGLVVVRLLERTRRMAGSATWPAVVTFGAAMWLLATVLTSVTLVTLFSVNGLVLTAFVLRAATAALDDELG